MAEIKITKKTPIWPWILLLLIVIAGIIFYFYYTDSKDDDVLDTSTTEKEVTFTENQSIILISHINS
jgi:hypothetical protein